MPYNAFGQGVTADQLRKEQEYVERHSKRIAVANAIFPLFGLFFFVAGVVAIGVLLVMLVSSGEPLKMAAGVAGFVLVVGGSVFALVEGRVEV